MIKATQITKSFDGRQILKGIDLEVADGEFLSIMGESGSGKSTFLSILAGNLRADSGSVLLDGEDLSSMNEKKLAKLRRTKLGFVYQSLNLIPTLNVKDNILLPLYLDRASLRKGRERMEEMAELLRVSHLMNAFPKDMSGGECQRVAIARAMVHEPSVLMLDEPTGSLDTHATADVMELLCRLNRECGVTVIQVTHSRQTSLYGDRTVFISDGLVSLDAPATL